ncbi:hypothetical protein [Prosthecobacter sp.]|uniref:hypothetical protein n=1 Tax=Prosthecobacter sp. TaxID=1965333 RepID=UPI001D1E8B9B|nr:hypothetical protein [Prosthecobacter sp.]MCB1279140.1 hypothetical protein [Prosthecobacter sp.]
MPAAYDFFGSLIFGSIGLGALLYGRSTGSVKNMILGALLLACAYLVADAWLLWMGGALLTAGLFVWKE